MVVERGILRPLFGREEGAFLLVTFGLALMLTDVMRLGWGPYPLNVPAAPMLKGIVWLAGEPYPVYRLFLIATLRVFGDYYFPEMAMASQFLLMALVLGFRPGGLLGKAEI